MKNKNVLHTQKRLCGSNDLQPEKKMCWAILVLVFPFLGTKGSNRSNVFSEKDNMFFFRLDVFFDSKLKDSLG